MIQLGKIQKLEIIRQTDIGVYLEAKEKIEDRPENAILLPKKQVPPYSKVGDEIEVFVYRDSEDRMIATTRKPKVTIDSVAPLKVVEMTNIGAFLDWGLEKDLFLPFKEQVGEVVKGKSYLVGVYSDKSDRLCGTMKIYDLLSSKAPYEVNAKVQGTIYKIEELGAFVAVDNQYHGLIPQKELYGDYKIGDVVQVRIKAIRPDGKLELSLRKQMHHQMEDDAKKIMDALDAQGGTLQLNDNSSPDKIKAVLKMSKGAFKRAVGRLMKEGAITLTDVGIKKNW